MAVDTTLRLRYPTGANLYTQIEAPDGTVWNGTAFVAFTVGDWATFATATPETPSSSGRYVTQFPTTSVAGLYTWATYLRAGGSPASTDAPVAGGSGYWDGTTFGSASGIAGIQNSLTPVTGLGIAVTISDTNPTSKTFTVALTVSGNVPVQPNWVGRDFLFTTGTLAGAVARIVGYRQTSSTTAELTVGSAFTVAPSNGDQGTIL